MERSSDRWHEVNLSRFVWEREGLDVVRRGLPDVSPIRAWANVEFVSHDGSINEVDLIVLTSAGLFLVELKAWSGRISGDGQQWRWTPPNATNHKFVPNPILATNSKAKKLRSLLNGQPALRGKCPRVEELVFLSSNDLDCQLLPIGRQRVFGRPAGGGGGPKRKGGEPLDSILDVLLGRMPVVDRGALGRITPDEAAAVARAVEQANIRPCQAERRAGDYVLTSKLGEAEELWEDWVGEHTAVRAKRRIRRWLSGVAGNAEYAARLARAANREFTFLAALDHPAVDRPLDYRETEYGPVLVYPYDEAMRPLATWLDEEGPRLTLDVRLDLIRQLAEVLQHAHGRRAYHRALSASVVDVVPGADGPQLRVRDWATGARESEGLPGAVGDVSLTGTVHVGELVADPSRGFLAPETFNGSGGDLDPVALDVFALGAVAYLILSGQAPAANAAELRRLLHDQGALDVGAAVDGLHETLAEMVRDATQANPELRCSIADVLTALDLVAEDLHPPVPAAATDHDEPTAKPTEAGAGDRLAGGWVVKRRLGTGSTAVAYLTEQNGREVVLKVAHEPSHHDRLLGEFEVLQPLDHPTIVRAFDIDEIEGHPALVLASAGHKTLAQRLREDLPDLSLLQRWGEDLLEALEYLEDHGVAHRDVKPENLGVRERRDGKLHLGAALLEGLRGGGYDAVGVAGFVDSLVFLCEVVCPVGVEVVVGA